MIREEVLELILSEQEPENAQFQERIIKSSYKIHGVRVPKLRKLAKKLLREKERLQMPADPIYEELLLYGFYLAYEKEPFVDKKERIEAYLGTIDSWALCDSFCSSFTIKRDEREDVLEFLNDLLESDEVYYKRFVLVMFLSHFLKLDSDGEKLHRPRKLALSDLNCDNKGKYLNLIVEILQKEYPSFESYTAAGWLGAEAFLFYPSTILNLLENGTLDINVKNTLIKKILESKTPDSEVKDYIRSLRNRRQSGD